MPSYRQEDVRLRQSFIKLIKNVEEQLTTKACILRKSGGSEHRGTRMKRGFAFPNVAVV